MLTSAGRYAMMPANSRSPPGSLAPDLRRPFQPRRSAMRIARLLTVIAIAVCLLYVIAQSAQARAPEAPAVTVSITVTFFADEWNDTSPASASTKCSLREALHLAYSAGNRGCGNGNQAANIVNIQFFGSGT